MGWLDCQKSSIVSRDSGALRNGSLNTVAPYETGPYNTVAPYEARRGSRRPAGRLPGVGVAALPDVVVLGRQHALLVQLRELPGQLALEPHELHLQLVPDLGAV